MTAKKVDAIAVLDAAISRARNRAKHYQTNLAKSKERGTFVDAASELVARNDEYLNGLLATRLIVTEMQRCIEGMLISDECKHPAVVRNNWRRSLEAVLKHSRGEPA